MAKNDEVEVETDEKPTPSKFAKHPGKPLKLIKFGADWCGHCVAMKKTRQLEKLAERHTEVEVIVIDVDKESDEADRYDVKGMPALFFEDAEGYILAEHEGGLADATLEKLYQKAKSKIGA